MIQPFAGEAARCHSAQQKWAFVPLRERLRCARLLRQLIAERADALALAVTQDVGRPASEVLATDILPTADACKFLEKQASRLLRPRRIPKSQRPLWLFGVRDTVHRRARGVVGIIGTWNYPIFLNAVQMVQALTAGNGVLWKPSELTPTLATALHQLFLDAGFPVDLLIRLPATREAGFELAEADVAHVVFTGSADVGRRLAKRLGERLVSSTLELSGCDAMIVAADADVPMAVKAAWWGVTLNHGQTCIALRRIFVARPVYRAFVEQLRVGASSQPEPLMMDVQATQAESLVKQALDSGALLLLPGLPPKAEADPPRFPPTFVIDARPDMALCRDAAFAPIAAVIPFDTLDEVVAAQSLSPYALGASIFSAGSDVIRELEGRLPTGMVCINDVLAPTAHPATPFGGNRDSGWGVTQGAEGLLEMTVPQVVSTRSGRFRPHYDNHPATADLLQGMLCWQHSARFGDRWRGFWKMVRAGMKMGGSTNSRESGDSKKP